MTFAKMNSSSHPKTDRGEPSRKPNHTGKRRWLPYLGAFALLGIIVVGLWPQPTPVEVARATTGQLRTSVNEEGKTRVRHRFVVTAPVAGQLRRIGLKPGADVQRGSSVLAVIDPVLPGMLDARSRTQAEAKRDAAAAQLEKAQAAHRFALNELRRFEKLFAGQAVSIQELEPVQWREAAASRDLSAAESAFRQTEAELAEVAPRAEGSTELCRNPIEIESPASGRVLKVFEESARVVAAGTPLLEVGDASDLEVVVEVLSRDGAAISPGARVELDQWGAGITLEGRVRLVEPAAFTKVSALGVEEQRVNVIVDLLTPADQRRTLGDSFRVEARIIVWETKQTLKVPSGALFRQGEQWAAFVLDHGRAQLRPLKVGRNSDTEMQILEGLKEGEALILYPGDRVRNGQRALAISIAPAG